MDNIVYSSLRKYVQDSLDGVGALKGASCQIQSIEPIEGGNRVTYKWVDEEGDAHTDHMDVMDGVDGDTGATGPAGPQGPKGDDGADGSVVTATQIVSTGTKIAEIDVDGNTTEIYAPNDIWKAQGELGAKNILYFPYDTESKRTSGIGWTINDDGSVTVDGTASSYSYIDLRARVDAVTPRFIPKNNEYTLSIAGDVSGTVTFLVRIADSSTGTTIREVQTTSTGKLTFTNEEISAINSGTYCLVVRLFVLASKTVNNVTVYPMIRLASDPDDTWRPYAKTNLELTKESAGNAVTVNQVLTSGIEIAEIEVGENTTKIYAPQGGGSASALDDLSDVEITDLADGDVLSYNGEKWVNVPQTDPPTPTPTERTETITTYTSGKTLKWKDANHIPSEIMVADSAYTLGITGYVTLENATKIVVSAYAVTAEWNITCVFYDANKTPIYGCCPGMDGVPVDTTNKFIKDHEISIYPNAKYARFVFWNNELITWEHPYAKVTYTENVEPSGEIQTKRFNVTINKATVESGGYTSYSDYGILFLPSTYKATGKKTRLVIACHGSGTVIDNNFDIDTKDYVKTLVHMGYAVMDVNGGVTDGRHYGAQFAMQSYIKAYHYVISNYNLYPEVFIFGASMGGLCSFGLVQNGSIPVIAQAAICPVTDLLRQAWMNPWWNDGGNYGRQRERIAEYYNFDNYESYTSGTAKTATTEDMQYFVDNAYKTMGYNPMVNKAVNGVDVITEATAGYAPLYSDLVKFHNVPLMVSHAENDDAVAYEFTTYIVSAIIRGGGEVYFKSYPTGGHSPNLGGTVTLTGVDGNTFTSYDSLSRVVSWFNRFN